MHVFRIDQHVRDMIDACRYVSRFYCRDICLFSLEVLGSLCRQQDLRSRQLSRDQKPLCKVFTQSREKIDNVDIKVGQLVEGEHGRAVTGDRASGSRPSLMILILPTHTSRWGIHPWGTPLPRAKTVMKASMNWHTIPIETGLDDTDVRRSTINQRRWGLATITISDFDQRKRHCRMRKWEDKDSVNNREEIAFDEPSTWILIDSTWPPTTPKQEASSEQVTSKILEQHLVHKETVGSEVQIEEPEVVWGRTLVVEARVESGVLEASAPIRAERGG